jgi:anti-sigma regulatory factor (Ser/Thr protein kinase)
VRLSQPFEHQALIYGSVGELRAAAVPFLTEGLAAGQAVVLVCRSPLTREIVTAIGRDASVRVVDPAEIFTGSARAVAALRRLALDCDGSSAGVRIVGSVPFEGSPDGFREWGRYEAAVNVALAPLRLSSICAYDKRDVPKPVRAIIGRTHPFIRTPRAVQASPHFLDPATFVRLTTPDVPDPAERAAPDVDMPAIEDVYDLAEARSAIRGALARAPVGGLTVGDFTAAAGELLANAVQHGRPAVQLRLWIRPDRLVCTVHDRGPGFDDPLAGYIPPPDAAERGGAGLWLARQTCDSLDMRQDRNGFRVRATIFPDRHRGKASMAGARARAELVHRRMLAARARAQQLDEKLQQRQDALVTRERAAADGATEIQRRSTARTHGP